MSENENNKTRNVSEYIPLLAATLDVFEHLDRAKEHLNVLRLKLAEHYGLSEVESDQSELFPSWPNKDYEIDDLDRIF
jgi:hypothetical protein